MVNWKILELESAEDGTVTNITYECKVTKNNQSERIIRGKTIDEGTHNPLTQPFDDLTEEVVLGWITNPEKNTIEKVLNSVLKDKKDKKALRKPKGTKSLPWGKNKSR